MHTSEGRRAGGKWTCSRGPGMAAALAFAPGHLLVELTVGCVGGRAPGQRGDSSLSQGVTGALVRRAELQGRGEQLSHGRP